MGDAASGFAYSIYVMLLAVFGIAGAIVWKIVKASRVPVGLEPPESK